MSDLDPRRKVVTSPWSLPGWSGLDAPARAEAFMAELTVAQGRGAGSHFRLRDWQRDVNVGLLGQPRPSVGIVSIARGNGKSSFAGALALYVACADGQPSPFVPLVATTEEQARRLLAIVVRYVKRHERLAERARVYSDRVVFPAFDEATIIALPAESGALLGLDFSFAILDEIGAMRADTWEAVLTGQGKRDDAVVLGIGSRVPDGTDLLEDLLVVAEGEDHWRTWCWSAAAEVEVLDEVGWADANPTLDDLVKRETLRTLALTVPEPSFRAYRLNQRVDSFGTWINRDDWAALTDLEHLVADGEEVVLGFDGSYSGDSTALIGCTLDRHLWVVQVWANPGDPNWRVPRAEVDATVAAAFDRWTVRSLVADPWGWRSELEAWEERFGDEVVLEWPTNATARMGPACDRFYTAVKEANLSHDGDHRLAAHVANAHVKTTTYGGVIVKDGRGSPRKIDAAVAAVVAFDRAAQLPPKKSRRLFTF